MKRFRNTYKAGPSFRPHTALLALAALVLLVFPAFAQDTPDKPVTADDVNAVAKKMYCPVCENIPLDVCSTTACAQWRDEIRIQLQQGRSEQEIKDFFVERYGDRVLGVPQSPTLQALSLLTPWLIAAVAAVIALLVLTRWWRGQRASAPPVPQVESAIPDDDYRDRLERDLQARR